jgi:sugar lactone lactonase YvrE
MVTDLIAELVFDARARLGEGPVWDAQGGVLWWVDIEGRRIHRYDPVSRQDRALATPSEVGAVALRSSGGLAVALADGIWTLNPAPGDAVLEPGPDAWRSIAPFVGAPDVRCNDAKCDPVGRLIVGTMAVDERPVGGLFSVERNGGVRQLLDGLAIANGLAWSRDGRTFYFIDSPTRQVGAWDYDLGTGAIARQRVHLSFDDGLAMPDGMTIDAEGGLWIAFWDGWEVRRYAPNGTLDVVVRVPAAQVTSCTFGGPDLADLYITTAANGFDSGLRAAQPGAGGLFRVRPGIGGVPPDRFAG